MKDITECSVINKLDNDFVQQFKFAYIFNGQKSAIIITNDDCVYVCGNNKNGCLGLGHNVEVEVPTKLDELCNKRMINIIADFWVSIVYALTSDGLIYYWGSCDDGRLGCISNDVCLKPAIIDSLKNKFVIKVKSEYQYSLALTINGEVYEWGYRNEVADVIEFPKKVFALKLHTIIAISSGYEHSLALNDNGEVFGWGKNGFGQCGCGHNDDQEKPIKINGLGDIKVSKISCGYNHSLVLTECGDIYAFGCNNYGQLGDNTKVDKNIATKITNSIKYNDISTLNIEEDNSFGLSTDGLWYVWGNDGEEIISIPTKTEYKNIEDVIQEYIDSDLTYNLLYFKKMFDNLSVYERLVETFDKQEYSDLSFKIDGKYIYVQKPHLMNVCKHFKTMFASNVWLESNAKEVEITQYSYSVYHTFLKYLYTDSVDIQSKHLIELYYLADSYLEENLKRNCIERMKNSTNVNNVYTFYSFAVQNNLEKLEKYFYNYIIEYMSDVIKTDAYIQSENNSILKRFVNTSTNNGHFKRQKLN